MQINLVKTIEQIGLEERQAKVYLAALEIGGGSVLDIARKAGIERVGAYYVLDQLLDKGLVYLSEIGKTRVYTAVSPKNLVSRVENNLEQLQGILPQLLSIENSDKSRPIIRFFEGQDGLGQILDDMIETLERKPRDQREILEYVSPDSGFEALKKPQTDFIKNRIRKKIKLRWISPDTTIAKEFMKNSIRDFREMRLVPKDKFGLLTEMNIYANKINLIGEKGVEVGVIIEHSELAETQREIFELAWLGASTFPQPKKVNLPDNISYL